MIDEGHEIGNHSYTHNYSLIYRSGGLDDFRDDILQAQDFIWENFGYMMTSFRFPGGSMGRGASIIQPRRELIEELGYQWFDWHIDSGDANPHSSDRRAVVLTSNVLTHTRGREQLIILMHDSAYRASTLEALPAIIAGLREQGYTFDVLRNYYPAEDPPECTLQYIPEDW